MFKNSCKSLFSTILAANDYTVYMTADEALENFNPFTYNEAVSRHHHSN